MSIQINYTNSLSNKKPANLVFFTDEKYNISSLKKYISKMDYEYIFDLIKTKNLKKNLVSFDISSKKKIILISLKKNISYSDTENLGAKFFDKFKEFKQNFYVFNSDTSTNKSKNVVGHFLHGLKLKSYLFEK